MADEINLEVPTFSILNNMNEMGNMDLLTDLMEEEVDPKDIKPITASETTTIKPVVTTVQTTTIKEDPLGSFLEEEDKEDEDSTTTDTTTQKGSEKVEDEDNKFSALSKDLFKLNVFTKEGEEAEEEIKTPEAFLERFQVEKKKGAIEMVDNFIGQFGEDYQNAFDAIFVKGVNPKEYFSTYNNIVNFAEMDMTKEENQLAVIRQTLADQGLEPEDITTEVERIKNYGDVETVAQKYHKVLAKREGTKLLELEQNAEKQIQQKTAIRNQFVQNVQNVLQEKLKTKEFDGIPINPKLAEEVNTFLTKEQYKTPSGETLTEFDKFILDLKRPENHAMKVKFGLLAKLLEKDPTLATIQKAGVSKKTDALFTEITRNTGSKTTSTKTTDKPTSWF